MSFLPSALRSGLGARSGWRGGTKAQPVDEQIDHALTVARRDLGDRDAEVGHRAQELVRIDVGADLSCRRRFIEQGKQVKGVEAGNDPRTADVRFDYRF